MWPRLDPLAEVYAALVTGVRDYVRKNRFRSVILGLSGGIDSALTATIAADAIGPDRVHVVLDAQPALLRALGGRRRGPGQAAGRCTRARCRSQPMVDAFQADLQAWTGWPRRTSRPGCAASSS